MTAALLFILSHWRTAIVVSVIAGISVFAAIQRAHVAALEYQLSTASVGWKACRDGADALRSLIAKQNAAVDKLKSASDAQAVEGLAASRRSTAAIAASNARLKALRAEVVPTDCAGAVSWAAGKAKELSANWEQDQ